jgi:hypothetical protein
VDLGERVGADGRPMHRGIGSTCARSPAQRGRYITNVGHDQQGGEPCTNRREQDRAEKRTYRRATRSAPTWPVPVEARRTTPRPRRTPSRSTFSGAILPVWDRVRLGPESPPAVVRTQTDDGERFIGKQIPEDEKAGVLKNFGLGAIAADIPAAELMRQIMGGETAQLSNGWTVKKVRVSNDERMEIAGAYFTAPQIAALVGQGAIHERIQYRDRVFIPTNDPAVFERLTRGANRPVVEMLGGGDTGVSFSAAEPGGAMPQAKGRVLTDAQSEKDIEALRAGIEDDRRTRAGATVGIPQGAFIPVQLPYQMALQLLPGPSASGSSASGSTRVRRAGRLFLWRRGHTTGGHLPQRGQPAPAHDHARARARAQPAP